MRSAYLAWMMRRRSLRVGVELLALGGPLDREDLEPLDLLDAGQALVDGVDGQLDLGQHPVGGGQRGQVAAVDPVAGRPGRGKLVVEHDQGDHVRPVVAVDQGLADQRVLLEQALDVGRGEVLAAGGDDQLFLAVDDLEVPVSRPARRRRRCGASPRRRSARPSPPAA